MRRMYPPEKSTHFEVVHRTINCSLANFETVNVDNRNDRSTFRWINIFVAMPSTSANQQEILYS